MIRQVTRLGAKSAMRVPMRQTARPLVRSMSGLEGKERAEEKRYFAQLEADRVAAAKAQFEAVMASDDADAKEDLIESLGTSSNIAVFYFLALLYIFGSYS